MNKIFTEMQSLEGLVDLPELEELSMQHNGIISLDEIDTKFPSLTVLDVSHNKIFSVINVDILHNLPNLAEVNFNNNPICVHKQ